MTLRLKQILYLILVTEPILKSTQRPNMKNLRFKFQPIFVVEKLMKTLFLGIADITSITNLFSEWEVQNSSDLSLCITMA